MNASIFIIVAAVLSAVVKFVCVVVFMQTAEELRTEQPLFPLCRGDAFVCCCRVTFVRSIVAHHAMLHGINYVDSLSARCRVILNAYFSSHADFALCHDGNVA